MNIIIIYLMISVVVAIIDLRRMYKQEEYLNSFPIGDIDYYVQPKTIVGIHNWLFFPSWLIIAVVLAVISLINRVF